MSQSGADSILDAITARLPGSLIALDFDGTLAPIVLDPSTSSPVAGAVAILTELATAGANIAIVTGRDALHALQLSRLDALPGLVISGLHGAQHWHAGELVSMPEPPGLDDLRVSLPPILEAAGEGVWLEDKVLSLVVHTRRAPDPEGTLHSLMPTVTELSEAAGLHVLPGHLILEVRMPGVSKGDAIAELVTDETPAVFYAGDDHGDLAAIKAVQEWSTRTGRPGFSVGVGDLAELEAVADLLVESPAELVNLLARLLPAHRPR